MRRLRYAAIGMLAAALSVVPATGYALGTAGADTNGGLQELLIDPAYAEGNTRSSQIQLQAADDQVIVAGSFDYDEAKRELACVNEEREKEGKDPLVMDADLQAAAMQRAAEISLHFSHTRPDGSTCFSALPDNVRGTIGENIAFGRSSAESVTQQWMDSSGHRANILSDDYTSVGIGCYDLPGGSYWVQMFSDHTTIESFAGTGVKSEMHTVEINNASTFFAGSGFNLNMRQEDPEPLVPGESYELRVHIRSSEGFAGPTYSGGYTWTSSDPSAFEVDKNGVVTAQDAPAGSTATITAKSEGGHTWTKNFIIEDQNVPVTGVSLTPPSISLDIGESWRLTATVSPSNATDKRVTWWSTGPDVATVDSNGNVTAVGEGTATIMVKTVDGGYTDFCMVTAAVHVTGVRVDRTEFTMSVGETQRVKVTVLPENATNRAYIFEGYNRDIISIDAVGNIRALAPGKTKVAALSVDGSYQDHFTVTVTGSEVTGVALDKTALELDKGESYTLKATVSPAEAENKDVTWKSSDTKVATVDASGKVTAVAPGSATITVKTEDGGKTATCAVSVAGAVTGVTLDKAELALKQDESYTLKATVAPEDAENKKVTWKSSDAKVATVDANGKVTGAAPGTATITVTTEDGQKTATCKVTVGDALTVTFVPNGGSAVDEQTVSEGERAKRPADPTREYYRFTGWFADSGLKTAYDFSRPVEGDLTLYAGWTGYSPYRGFTDVLSSDWYVTGGLFDYALDNGLMNGYAGTTNFGPYDTITRAQVACVLWNMAGKPAPGDVADFDDNLDTSAYYYNAVRWARSAGVANGYAGTNTFNPNGNVSRQELATFLCNYASKVAKLDTSSDMEAASQISGWSGVQEYAKPAIAWAVDQGLMSGVETDSGQELRPLDTAWRASMATMSATLHRDVIDG